MAPLQDGSWIITLSCKMDKSTSLTVHCSPWRPLLCCTGTYLHGSLWACQQSPGICRFEPFLPRNESCLGEKAPPTIPFFIEVSIFALLMGFSSQFRSFLGPGPTILILFFLLLLYSSVSTLNLRQTLSLLLTTASSSQKSPTQ